MTMNPHPGSVVPAPGSATEFHEVVAANVRAEMARWGVTQGEVAERLGVSPQSVSAKRRGRTPFTLNELAAVASLLGLSVCDLVVAVDPR